jgi:DNA polymerase
VTLNLDARQVAMLQEMGVRVFAPPPEAGVVPSPPVKAAVSRPVPVPAPAPSAPVVARLAAAETSLGPMEWDALQAAVAQQVPAGRKAIFGIGDLEADWMVVGDVPSEEDEAQGLAFAGDAGRLLDNMLAAVGANRRRGAYLTHLLKWRPTGNRNPEPDEVAGCEPFLRRQLELVQPRVVLAMGRFAVQSLLQSTEPIGKLRGRVHQWQQVPVVVTYHPGYLLRNPADKARAWADLCLARALLRAQA